MPWSLQSCFAGALIGVSYLGLLSLCARRARRPLALAAPLALGLLIGWESLLFNALSPFRAITAPAVICAHLALLAALMFDRRNARSTTGSLRQVATRLRRSPQAAMLAPLLLLLLVCAIAFSPSNSDSMVYHLSRVANWIENRSIAYYPASNPRQNLMSPGAELVLLALQVSARSDAWANILQLSAYLIAVAAIAPLARIAGVPRKLAPWASLFVAGLPIAALEATTSQNDLVATVVTMAMIVACLPFMRIGRPPRDRDFLLLAAMGAAGVLVKPTSVLVASPFLLWAIGCTVSRALRAPRLAVGRWRAALAAIAVVAALAGPDLVRKKIETASFSGARYEVFPPLGDWTARLINGVRATCEEIPDRHAIRAIEKLFGVEPALLYCDYVFLNTEDLVGNPAQFAVSLGVLVFALAFCWRLGRRERLFPLGVLLSWVALHMVIRDQQYITRLQLPSLALTPLAWSAFTTTRLPLRPARARLLALAALICFTHGVLAACTNVIRPISIPRLTSLAWSDNYYVNQLATRARDEGALRAMRATGCQRLGLAFTSEDTFDYPITWRAMQAGGAARYEPPSSAWPCLLYSDRGSPPADGSRRWVASREPFVFVPAP